MIKTKRKPGKLYKTLPKSQIIIAEGLAEFFEYEPELIVHWLLTKNPHFGNISPAELIVFRQEKGLEKVAKFIKNAKEGRSP